MSCKAPVLQSIAAQRRSRPFFSIIVPVWNRRDSITRCLDSVLLQDYDSYEIVVVDDGSDDDTLAVIQRYIDSRMRLLQHNRNQGVCAARRTATAASQGEWILSLDSDWALLPGALKALAAVARNAQQDLGVIGACAQSDHGERWPSRPAPEGCFGFLEYLRWIDTSEATDFLSCRRRQVFAELNWPADRRLEMQFNLRVAKRWRHFLLPEVLAVAYTDCPNRYMVDRTQRGILRKLERAPDEAASREEILEEFGSDLKRHVPSVYFTILTGAAHNHYCAGNRLSGLKYTLLALRQRPWSLAVCVRAVVGLIGPACMVTLGHWRSVYALYHTLTRSR